MAIRADLKRKLKASDRRRRRRHEALNSGAEHDDRSGSADVGPDVVGLIVRDLVQLAVSDRELVDGAAIAGLRGSLNGSLPTGDQSKIVFDRVQKIAGRADVSERCVRNAVKSLLEIASKHQGKEADPKSFLSYLAVLVG